jgi:hypothetical protein
MDPGEWCPPPQLSWPVYAPFTHRLPIQMDRQVINLNYIWGTLVCVDFRVVGQNKNIEALNQLTNNI